MTNHTDIEDKRVGKHQGCRILQNADGFYFAAGSYEEGYFPTLEDAKAAIESYTAEKLEAEAV